jgi:hypothetical protein
MASTDLVEVIGVRVNAEKPGAGRGSTIISGSRGSEGGTMSKSTIFPSMISVS